MRQGDWGNGKNGDNVTMRQGDWGNGTSDYEAR